MNLIIDIRERSLIEVCENLKKLDIFKNVLIKIENLDIGDIIIQKETTNIVIIERKTVSDLISSIKDGRYAEQSFRLDGIETENHNIIYLIEGSLRGLSSEKQMVYSSIFSINYYKGFSVHRSENINETAYIIMNMYIKLHKEKNKKSFYPKNKISNIESKIETDILNENIEEESDKKYCTVVKKKKNENITRENFGEIILCQIPSVNSITAIAIMKEFLTINNLIEKLKIDEKCLDGITTETNSKKRKISKACVKNIIKFLKC